MSFVLWLYPTITHFMYYLSSHANKSRVPTLLLNLIIVIMITQHLTKVLYLSRGWCAFNSFAEGRNITVDFSFLWKRKPVTDVQARLGNHAEFHRKIVSQTPWIKIEYSECEARDIPEDEGEIWWPSLSVERSPRWCNWPIDPSRHASPPPLKEWAPQMRNHPPKTQTETGLIILKDLGCKNRHAKFTRFRSRSSKLIYQIFEWLDVFRNPADVLVVFNVY